MLKNVIKLKDLKMISKKEQLRINGGCWPSKWKIGSQTND